MRSNRRVLCVRLAGWVPIAAWDGRPRALCRWLSVWFLVRAFAGWPDGVICVGAYLLG